MILGITGTIGAGKGAVVEYLTQTRGFAHYSARDFITQEVTKRGLSLTRDHMQAVADDLRAQHTPSYILEELFKAATAQGGDVVIESVRTLGEGLFLKEHGVKIVAVDADRKRRYDRIVGRGLSTDNVSFLEFCDQEDAELSNEDPNKQNLLGVMARADYHVTNDGTLEELHARVDELLKENA